MTPDAEVTRSELDRAVINAAISWSIIHTPITGPHDQSPAADRARAKMRAASEAKPHAAVEAMFAEYDAAAKVSVDV